VSARRAALLALLGATAAGLFIRLAAAAAAVLWFDEGTAGLMGRRTLAGEFLVYFHGQAYMGAVDGYLHALPFALLGSSIGTLRLLPICLSLLHVALCAVLARRVAGDGRWAAVLALVPTPILLKWAHDARLYYDLVPILTLLMLLLGLRVMDPRATPADRTRALLVAGLVAGIAWWTNLIHTIPIVVTAGVIVLRRPRLRPAALALPLAFVVGSAPVWLFGAAHGHLGAIRTPLAEPGAVVGHAQLLLTNALPLLVGWPPPALAGPVGLWFAGGSLIVLMASIAACARAGPGGWLVAGVVGLGSTVVIVAEHGKYLGLSEPLYLIPVVAVLPVALGVLLARLASWRSTAALTLTAALLSAHVAGLAVRYAWVFSPQRWATVRAVNASMLAIANRLEAAGLTAVYTHDPEPGVLTFATGERVLVSHLYQERYPPLAERVDAASRVAYLAVNPPAGFDRSLAATGAAWTTETLPLGWRLYTGFRLEQDGHREIPAEGWTATASHQAALARHAIDRDARTSWNPRTGQATDIWIQVDLGGPREVGMIALVPRTFQEVPPGLRVELSLDGRSFTTAVEVPTYYGPLYWSGGHPMGRVRWGRVELRFSPARARFVRVAQLGAGSRFAWSVRELFVYEPGPAAPVGPAATSSPVAALERAGAHRVLGDHAVAARLAQASGGALVTSSANLHALDGTMAPPGLLPALVPAPDLAIAYAPGLASAASIEAILTRAGWSFAREDVGNYRLLTRFARRPLGGTRLAREGWRLRGGPDGGTGEAAADGRLETRWSTGRPQRPGDSLEVDLPAPTTLVGVDVELGGFTTDYPRDLVVEIAREDGSWTRVPVELVLDGPLVWAGTHVLRDGVEHVALRFAPIRTRAVRLVQTGEDPVYDWSVAELHLLGP
jgi:hypothetical protein